VSGLCLRSWPRCSGNGSQRVRHNLAVSSLPSFADLASDPEPAMDVLALAVAAEFRTVDARATIAMLDVLGVDLSRTVSSTSGRPRELALACGQLLGREQGFAGDRERYDDPDNSMLDVVLARRRGLPILLSVVYIEVARRADIPLAGVGLPGHFVVGHFGCDPPVLLDPFSGGARIDARASGGSIRPWHPHEIAARMLNNLVASYQRRGDLTLAIRAAQMRLALPVEGPLRDTMNAELRALQARLN
jgi:regulator of sirC expression with transglutaminase-like and TPR domain